MTDIGFSHVVCTVNDADAYVPETSFGDAVFPVAFQSPSAIPSARVQETVWPHFDAYNISPTQTAVDLYRAAAAVYAADTRILRTFGYDRWTRMFVLHLPVSEPSLWQAASTE